MAEALVVEVESPGERTPIPVRLRWAFHRSRAAVLPRRWAIPWEMRDSRRYYARAVADAKARKASRDEIQALESEGAHFYWELEEELEMLESNRLIRKAKKYMLPTPDFHADEDNDPSWQRGTTFKPNWYLRPLAMQDLRTQIRAERKARREPIAEWVKIIGGLGGVIYLVQGAFRLLQLLR
jgi:hypothetical protein